MHLLFIRSDNLDLPIDLQIKFFDNTIVPILTYGCKVFGYENLDILEGVHLEFLPKLGRLRKLDYPEIYDLCGVGPIPPLYHN